MPIKILLVLALLAISFSNFGRGLPKEHFCEIILKLGHWPRRKCRLNVFFFSIFSSRCHFVQRSKAILATLVVTQGTFL